MIECMKVAKDGIKGSCLHLRCLERRPEEVIVSKS